MSVQRGKADLTVVRGYTQVERQSFHTASTHNGRRFRYELDKRRILFWKHVGNRARHTDFHHRPDLGIYR
jgi:hypothetical protein